ncbi:MAG: adenylate/guanylate cyclase domain-containing protein [Acidiferrobacterales bacterium]
MKTRKRTVARQYYLSMLSLAAVVLIISTASISIAGHPDHLPDMALGVALVLVVLNLIGARFIFAPIARYLSGRADFEPTRCRLRRLPILSAGWTFLLMSVHMYPQYFFHHVWDVRNVTNLAQLLVYPAVLIAIFGAFMSLYVYFLIGDYTARLKDDIFRRDGLIIEPGAGRMLYKLIVAFVAVSVVPLALFFFRTYFFEDFRQLQGLEITQILQIDMLGAVFLTGIAIVFITRNLTRPVNMLLASMQQVGEGDLETRAPVVSDDEIGRLTVGFNVMAEGLEDRAFIRETLGKFVSESIATAVLQDRGVVRPQVREATILFTDIERFTAISEKLHPEEVIALLNEYFAVAAQPIHDNGGVITQFQGDAMLASFNLPVEDANHAANAVRAASAIQRLLANRRFGDGIALNTRVGINTGLVVGGTVGDGDRLGYTVHDDVVNLAARLEQLNKEYDSRVLLSQRTAELAGDSFAFKKIGEVAIRGHETPVTIYELPGP